MNQGVLVYNEKGQVLVLANIEDPQVVGRIMVEANRRGLKMRIANDFYRTATAIDGYRSEYAPDEERQEFRTAALEMEPA